MHHRLKSLSLAITIPLLSLTSALLLLTLNFESLVVQAQTSEDSLVEANRLVELGVTQFRASQFESAIHSWQQALAIYRNLRNLSGEAKSLEHLGWSHLYLGQYEQATEFYHQRLAIARNISDRQSEADSLNKLGWAYSYQGQYQQAINFFQQALELARDINDPKWEANSLGGLGWAYFYLGQYHRGNEFHQQWLSIARKIGDRQMEAYSLGGLGNNYLYLGQYELAIKLFQQQLTISVEINDRRGQANSLRLLGNGYNALGQYQQALDCSQQSLSIVREIADRRGEVYSLVVMGEAYGSLGRYQKAMESYQQSLSIAREIGDRQGQRITLSYIGNLLTEQNQPELAIIFFKQSVNVIEAIRQDLRVLPEEQQQSFTETVAHTYRNLADLLLKQDRILEAQQVLELLKVQELDDYLRNVRGNEQTQQGVEYLPAEQQLLEQYNTKLTQVIQVGKELEALQKIPLQQRTSQQEQRRRELETLAQMSDYSILHLATHAAFVTGQPEESFILFGNGDRANFRDVETWPLTNTDLVVLSACETGLGGKLGDGREILGFGYLMQQAGAKAAIASLWMVDDGGTQALMNAFYTALSHNNLTKAEALRQAQIALITGDFTAVGESRGTIVVQQRLQSSLPQQVTNHLSHPYYWAPFILIGNGL
ncbi:MAG TPA: hypothetical protein DDZ80_28525 [Cyanobacteria bacterium UBA8803]|nr:hypothetical protein [Cyanobacteria bacterium UBA9273]HBL62202.1 hypothetical protein [Cyanobacteria bacterium UBA8803]